MKRCIQMFLFALGVVFVVGCTEIHSIPPGYVGKVLTPTGWQDGIIEAGQVDLGALDSSGRGNTLVLLEITAVTHKEQFAAVDNGEDHRIVTKNRVLVAVDVYCRLVMSGDKKFRDNVFATVTPEPVAGNPRVMVIKLETIYQQFARMGIRGKTRSKLAGYSDDFDILSQNDKVNAELGEIFATTFTENHVPLLFTDVQLSNVKVDKAIWEVNQRQAAAAAEVNQINQIGEAIKNNPGYLQFLKWQSLKEIAREGSAKGTNTIIVTDGGTSSDQMALPAAEYLRQGLPKSVRQESSPDVER